jgi:hypothetical protein
MEGYPHLMIDLETLDTRNTAAFPSLAAIPFDIETGMMGTPFYLTISLDSLFKAGLTVGAGTLQWWMDQRHEIAKKMFSSTVDLKDALVSLTEFIYSNSSVYVWGNSARFDCGILMNGYTSVGLDAPWKFYNERCYRTMVAMFPEIGKMDKPVDAHDPVVDCKYQITRLCAVFKALKQNGQYDGDLGYACTLLDEARKQGTTGVELKKKITEFFDGRMPKG